MTQNQIQAESYGPKLDMTKSNVIRN